VPKPAPPPPGLSYVVTVNGQTQMHPAGAPTLPRYVIAPGENLTITVEVTVPAHVTLTGLWLGITNDMLSPRPDGPADMSPILAARTRAPLGSGAHQFRLHWAGPAGLRPGTSRQLSVQWAWPNGLAEKHIAVLDVQRTSGAPSSLIAAHGPKVPTPHSRLYPDPWSGQASCEGEPFKVSQRLVDINTATDRTSGSGKRRQPQLLRLERLRHHQGRGLQLAPYDYYFSVN
jgi:hypothetical protein